MFFCSEDHASVLSGDADATMVPQRKTQKKASPGRPSPPCVLSSRGPHQDRNEEQSVGGGLWCCSRAVKAMRSRWSRGQAWRAQWEEQSLNGLNVTRGLCPLPPPRKKKREIEPTFVKFPSVVMEPPLNCSFSPPS